MFEEGIIKLLSEANLETLKHWVDNDMSLMQNLQPESKPLFNVALPFIKILKIDIDVDMVLDFLKNNRPDIHNIVTREWISKQVDEFNGKV